MDLTHIKGTKAQRHLLRNRLTSGAHPLKQFFDVRQLQDPDTGVQYLQVTLRPHVIKDDEHDFLLRVLKFFRKCRGPSDITMWIPTWSIEQKCLQGSWADIALIITVANKKEYRHSVTG